MTAKIPTQSWLGHLWWDIRLHSLLLWMAGPTGYFRHRRDFRRAMDGIIEAGREAPGPPACPPETSDPPAPAQPFD